MKALANNLSELLALVRKSIDADYLPEDWHSANRWEAAQVVKTDTGYLALQRDTIETDEGYIYHEQEDADEFGYDEIDEVYRYSEDIVMAYGRRGRETYTTACNCEEYRGQFYVSEYLEDNDLVMLHCGTICDRDNACWVEEAGEYYHTDDCYYWESDNDYHLDPEPEEDEDEDEDNKLWEYAGGECERNFVDVDHEDGQKFGFGMEIEKNEMPSFTFNRRELYDRTGAVIERDGSVSSGFELKTPVYNLFSKKTEERLSALKDYADIKNVEGAGGHIGFSMQGKEDEELLNLCRGFLPLIYAMHKKRMNNDYCKAKPISDLITDGAKMQSVRLRGHYIEFRIFSSVKNYNTILFRLSFFRILAQNIGANFSKVLLMALNEKHPLHQLLIGDVYKDVNKFSRLIRDAINIDNAIGEGKLTATAINKINDRLAKIEKQQAQA